MEGNQKQKVRLSKQEYKVPSIAEVRERIQSCPQEDIRMALKCLYLLGARVSEIVGNGSPSPKERSTPRGPKGTDVTVGIYKTQREIFEAAIFPLKTAKRQGFPRVIALPLAPTYEPWTEEILKFFQRRGENKVFPFTRQLLGRKVRDFMVFGGMEYSIEEYAMWKDGKFLKKRPLHNRGVALHALRHARAWELSNYYGFDGTDMGAYLGWTFRTVGLPSIMQRYTSVNWQRYFPKLLLPRPSA